MRRTHREVGYVQSGLILHLDAILNMGATSAHSNSTTTWYDLSSSANNVTLVSPSWSADYLTFTGSTKGQSGSNLNLSATNKFTVEIFFRSIGTSVAIVLEQTTNYNNNIGAILCALKDGSPSVRDISFGIRKNGGTGYLYGGINGFSEDLYQAIYDDTTDNYLTELEMYKNAISQTVSWNTNATATNNTTLLSSILYIGARAGSSLFFQGSIRAIRIYNRKLSLQELQQNKLEDFRRYGIIK